MPAISFRHVRKTYTGARGPVLALDDVSFDIEPGEFFGLLGPTAPARRR
jgi:ABC-2 type transport system ATP-binding protein